MLENRLTDLTQAVNSLITTIEILTATIEAQSDRKTAPAIEAAPKAPKKKAEAPVEVQAEVPEIEAQVEAPTTEAIPNRDDLQRKCMTIVRADRAKRKDVEDLINSYGGTLIRDVPEDKLAELAEKLDALV